VGEHGVEALFERTSAALHLGQQEPALECGKRGEREVVWVGTQPLGLPWTAPRVLAVRLAWVGHALVEWLGAGLGA
jgi:hypothetical protein